MVIVFLILTTLFLIPVGCSAITPLPPEDYNNARYAPGELIIKFKSGGVIEFPEGEDVISIKELSCHSESIAGLNKRYGLTKIERVFKGKVGAKGRDTFVNIYKFIFADGSLDMEIIAKEYSKQTEVIYAEPNYISTIQSSADE